MTLTLEVNGVLHEVSAGAETPLLYVLRNDLGLKGTRFGCGEESCGACTVIVDGRAVTSCTFTVADAVGKPVLTVESLGRPGELDPLQQAFVDEQAGQCGYCLSGILMASKALLDAEPDTSRSRIAEALERNLCRCGSHVRVLRAVERAARERGAALTR